MNRAVFVCTLLLLAALGAAAFAGGVDGKRTAAMDSQIGIQNYTYEFKVDGGKLTGSAKSQFSHRAFRDPAPGDEIKFNRKVGEIASEDFVAKRAK